MSDLYLQKLIFLDENILNPECHVCGNELSGFLITEKDLLSTFSPIDLGWLIQNKYIQKTEQYKPKLIIFLCKQCCKGEK